MHDVTIHHCRVRVLRRGGWSWGPTPRQLVDEIIRRLPELIAARFANQEDDRDIEVAEPVRVTIPVRLDASGKLRSGTMAVEILPPSARSMPAAPVPSRRAMPSAASTPGPEARNVLPHSKGLHEQASAACEASALARLLQRWRRLRCLGQLLRQVSERTRAQWDVALSARASIRSESQQAHESPVDEAVRTVLAKLGVPPETSELRILCRLVLAAETAAEMDRPVDDIHVWQAIERLLPMTIQPVLQLAEPIVDVATSAEATTSISHPSPVANEREPKSSATLDLQSRPRRHETFSAASATWISVTHQQERNWETQVESALPFLMLGPLAEIGFFDAVAATLEVEGIQDAWPAFAAALAYKALGVPDAYGRRGAKVHHDGAAFAGSREPVSEIAITELAQRTRAALSAPQAVIAHAILEAHPSGKPLLVHALECQAGFLLFEPIGALIIACAKDAETACHWHEMAENEMMLVPRAASDPALFRTLQANAIRFITDAPPTQKEVWRCLRSGRDHWWTNDAVTAEPVLLRHAGLMAKADEAAAEVWRTLASDRPTAPLAPHSDLDRLLTMAAAFALGRIAWSLWHEREPVDPTLALTRFASLGARIQFQEDLVRVTLPMGRRSWDLSEQRMLDDVHNVPWLDGRTVVFHVG